MVNVALLLAVGVNNEGHREILGLDIATGEDGAAWLGFWRSLTARGLSGVQLVISDDHPGLRDAIAATLPGASRQRCRTHYLRNLLTKVPRTAEAMVATMVRTIFAQPDPESTWAQHHRVVDHLTDLGMDTAADHLDEAGAEILAFTGFPSRTGARSGPTTPKNDSTKKYPAGPMSWASSPPEPRSSASPGALLAEQHDEWAITRRYMSLDSLNQARIRLLEPEPHQLTEEVALRTQIS